MKNSEASFVFQNKQISVYICAFVVRHFAHGTVMSLHAKGIPYCMIHSRHTVT